MLHFSRRPQRQQQQPLARFNLRDEITPRVHTVNPTGGYCLFAEVSMKERLTG